MDIIEKRFKLNTRNTTLNQELLGGLTTFLTMSYIVVVNPAMLSTTGMDRGALVTITCLAASFGTLLAGFWANVPFAMAPGMGLNAYFTYSLVIGKGVDWQTALGVVFLSGVFFLLLTLIGVREKIVKGIPEMLRLSVSAGIGLFLAFIGFRNLNLVVADQATLVKLGHFGNETLLGLLGLVIISFLEIKKIRGSLLIGILIIVAIAWLAGLVDMPAQIIATPPSIAPVALKLDILNALSLSLSGAIFSFMFVDLFDSIGTILACSYEAGMVEKDGSIRSLDKLLKADALATIFGALIGTSTTTTFVESASGIAEGARTGLASIVTGGLFLIVMFFSPLILVIPQYATAPALIIVGVYMFKNIKSIDFTEFVVGIPSFLTIIIMPFTSISTGISFGFSAYLILAIVTGKQKPSAITWIVGLLSMLNLAIGSF